MTDKKQSNQPTITKQANSQVTITGEITAEALEKHRPAALKNFSEKIKVDGFRAGNIPEAIVEKEVGTMAILDEMAQMALAEWYPAVLTEHDIQAIGRPQVNITKLAVGNPLEFNIVTSVVPTVALGDYKKIAKTINAKKRPAEVDDKEVTEAITQLRRFRAQAKLDEEKAKQAKEKGEKFVPTKLEEISDDDLPELTLEYVQAMGDFASVEDFTEKLKENLGEEKAKRAQEERRMEIMDALLEKTTIDMPELLVRYEVDRAVAQLQHDIAMSGLEFKDYLESIKKSEGEIREDMREAAEKRAKTRLVIDTIAQEENIKPDEDMFHKEVDTLMEMYKDNPNASKQSIQAYVAEVMQNQSVFSFLDDIK